MPHRARRRRTAGTRERGRRGRHGTRLPDPHGARDRGARSWVRIHHLRRAGVLRLPRRLRREDRALHRCACDPARRRLRRRGRRLRRSARDRPRVTRDRRLHRQPDPRTGGRAARPRVFLSSGRYPRCGACSAPHPRFQETAVAPSPVSSNPIMRNVLIWSAIMSGVVLVVTGVIGVVVGGSSGLWSAVLGTVIGFLFPALTAATILFANRWFGTPNYLVIFFGVFMGVFLVKILAFIIALNVVFGLDWVVRGVLYGALMATAIGSIVVDIAVIAKMHIPSVSDVTLPGDDDDEV